MAITLNKHASRCVKMALAKGMITTTSSPRSMLYDISRKWRKLCNAPVVPASKEQWSRREEAAAGVIVATLTYLQRIGCKDIERLLKETIEQQASGIE